MDLVPVNGLQMEQFQKDRKLLPDHLPASDVRLLGSLPHGNRGNYLIAQIGGIS